MIGRVLCSLVFVLLTLEGAAADAVPPPAQAGSDGVLRNPLLPPGPGNPRNSEGAFIELRDGRMLFVYSHFSGGGGDDSTACLAARFSRDGGCTWTDKDQVVVPNEGTQNVMSVSLLRLADGRIALFYLRKNSLGDCRPVMRISTDDARTWSPPALCVEDHVGYYVMNNDRAVQLKTGRIVLPVCLHNLPGYAKPDWAGILMCYLSDDGGRTWRRSTSQLEGPGRRRPADHAAGAGRGRAERRPAADVRPQHFRQPVAEPLRRRRGDMDGGCPLEHPLTLFARLDQADSPDGRPAYGLEQPRQDRSGAAQPAYAAERGHLT